ncbi:MAG: hypothetical protein KKA05_10440 [Alphaproteobacteria bacterium]|nr:hypothetical protein [Alphaproteobacteria bacterium]
MNKRSATASTDATEDTEATTALETSETVTPTAAETAPAPIADPAEELSGDKDWSKGAIVVSGDGEFPAKGKRPVIVAQTSEREPRQPEGTRFRDLTTPALKQKSYKDGADVYLRIGTEADMGKGRNLITVGGNIQQAGTKGLSDRVGDVHVGPASPVYAAINLAYNYGAREVEVLNASQDQQDQLAPWLAQIADKVKVTFG